MDHRSTRFIRRPVHRKVPRFFLTKDRWKMRALPRSFLGSEGKRACPSMIKSSPEFYPRRVAEHARTVLPLLLLLKLTERLALSSIVLSRRCGLVCAKSSEIIDTSSSTLATWTGGEMLFLPFFLSFNPLLYTFSKRFLLSSHLRLPISCLSIRFLPFPGFDNPKERNPFSFFFSIHDS